jgi:hypothetical protein
MWTFILCWEDASSSWLISSRAMLRGGMRGSPMALPHAAYRRVRPPSQVSAALVLMYAGLTPMHVVASSTLSLAVPAHRPCVFFGRAVQAVGKKPPFSGGQALRLCSTIQWYASGDAVPRASSCSARGAGILSLHMGLVCALHVCSSPPPLLSSGGIRDARGCWASWMLMFDSFSSASEPVRTSARVAGDVVS